MAEYIEREALMSAVLELPPKMDEEGYGWLGRRGVWQMIADFPAADVVEVMRCIEREAFKEDVRRLSTHYLTEWDTLGVLAAADRIPAADVRPVVLCRDCDNWNDWDSAGKKSLGNYRCSCSYWSVEDGPIFYTAETDFCSYAEKREEDNA